MVAHNDKPVLLRGIQPAGRHLCLDASRKGQTEESDVFHLRGHVGSPSARHDLRLGPHEAEEHRDVMRRKAPQDVFY
jgi:hypothetical protein